MKYKTQKVMEISADMHIIHIFFILLAYIFVSQGERNNEDEEKITRPSINIFNTSIIVIIYFLIGIVLFFLSSLFFYSYESVFLIIYYSLVMFFFRKSILIFLIRLYQYKAPANVRAKCVQIPNCSEYMIIAIKKYGIINGVKKGIERVKRCMPPTKVDYP